MGSRSDRAGAILGQRAAVGMMTPSDFPMLLANVASAVLLRGYEGVNLTFGQISREVSVPDFKEVSRVRMGGAPELEKVKDTGEYTLGSFDEAGEKYKIEKFGKRLAISRETILNDDLDTMGRIPMAMGRKAAELENKLVYSILLKNPNMADGQALFSAAHKNMVTAGLDENGLEAALLKLREQKGLAGERIRVTPRNLVCSPRRERVARKLLVLSTNPTTTDETNPYQGIVGVVVEMDLLDLDDPLAYFLMADPQATDMIEFAYLEGHRQPYIEWQTGFEIDGLQMKVRHEIGAKAIDHVGMVMVTP
ncbi:MAG: Mu-like prophage major head subunit gpT family protein [Planctomycetes bacterium]|nr:Mu-like prophage major head subunit gpT family protein [Planctomycetota bacterium]